MTMHLEGPWLSKTGKYKGKRKFRNAEAAQRSRELDAEWKALQKKWAEESDARVRNRAMKAETLTYTLAAPPGRETQHIPSLGNGMGVAAKKEAPQYTGTKIKGIGTMHKSNAVPIFSDDEAKDISSMRR